MVTFVFTIILGIIIVILGITNTKGNISSLHSYHRSRVADEDVLPFGKLVGLGTIIIGIAVIAMGALSICSVVFEKDIFTIIGTVLLIVGLIVGCAITFYAMKKYNNGIF